MRGQGTSIGFGAEVRGPGRAPDRRDPARGRARGPAEVRPDPGVRRPPAGGRDARGPRRRRADRDPDQAEERAGQAVPAAVRDGGREARLHRRRAAGGRPEGDRRARPARAACARSWRPILLDTMFELPGLDGVEEVVINREVVEGRAKPLYLYGERAEGIAGTRRPERSRPPAVRAVARLPAKALEAKPVRAISAARRVANGDGVDCPSGGLG